MLIFYMDRCITAVSNNHYQAFLISTQELIFSFLVSTNINSEFTQQDCRKTRTAERLCVTGLLLARSVMILMKLMFSDLFKGR